MKKINLLLGIGIIAISMSSCGDCKHSQSDADQLTAAEKEDAFQGNLNYGTKLTPTEDVNKRLPIYTNFTLEADISNLSENQKKMLPLLFEVADIMKDIYWQQVIGHKDSLFSIIDDENAKQFAEINYGPWDRLNGNKPFFNEIGEKPAGANFYPIDMTKEEFDSLQNEDKTSLYTLLRRDENGKLITVWYHEAYKPQLEKAADLMRKAAELADDAGFKKYLNMRADALLNDDYQASDFAWMDMRTNMIDFVVGPIENYEDALYGYKAANESFILIKDMAWSKKLSKFSKLLPELQAGLPIEDEYKKDVPGSDADMNAYEVVYYAGDCDAGSKTIAINLPNDEEVHLKMGSRKLQLKNAMQAKFDKILVPISEVILTESQRKHVKFAAFFENTMFHEVGHAMGIKNTINDKGSAREALKEVYSSIEEGKADIMGLWLVTKLYETGELTEGEVMDNYVTFFTSIFRSSRFGAASSHGKANMMRFNFFEDQGAFAKGEDGFYTVDFDKMQIASIIIMQKILHLQGNGDYETSKAWVESDGIIRPSLKADLDKINNSGIPVDITYNQGKSNLGL